MLREGGHHTIAPLQYVFRCISPHHNPLFPCGAMTDSPHSPLGQVMVMVEHNIHVLPILLDTVQGTLGVWGEWEVLDKIKFSGIPTESVEGSPPKVRQCGLSPTLSLMVLQNECCLVCLSPVRKTVSVLIVSQH